MNAPAPPDALARARAALAAHDWDAAYELASAAAPGAGEPAPATRETLVEAAVRLDLLADAAWWVGKLDESIAVRERAYAWYEEAGATRAAGQAAYNLAFHWCFKAKQAIGSGWLRRARRALDGDLDCAEYGFLLLYEAEFAHGGGEVERAGELAHAALDLGRRLRDPDVEAQALQAIGRLLIDAGRPSEGLAHLDEAMLFALEGRLSPLVTGRVYCSLVSACHDLGDIRRANEWVEAIGSWAEGHPFTIFPGLCRLHRADLLQWRGEWAAAEAEARRACEELETVFVANAAAAFAEIGEIRRRLGDLDGAEKAFAQAEALHAAPAAGLALLRLAQGRAEAASTIITSALEQSGWNRLGRAWLLPAAVQIAVAVGDVDGARKAAEELLSTAVEFESPVLRAAAAMATGRVEVAAGDAGACATLRGAVQRWSDLDVPYEAATARVLLARACRAADDEDGARTALAAAEATFAQLGAAVDLFEASSPRPTAPAPCGLSPRELDVLREVAAGRTNKQIAAALFLSDKTVARHLSNIFVKIGVPTRAAATAFAFEHGLVGD